MDEEHLVRRCQKGQSSAQRLIFERYIDAVLMICIRYLRNYTDAEGIASEVFVKCFRSIGTFEYRGSGSFYAWLSRIAVHECLMELRKKTARFEPLDDEQSIGETEEPAVWGQMQMDTLLRCIQQMPPGYRTVLNLFVFEDYSHKEIAEMLGISESTSKTQLRKARAFLKRQWEIYERQI